jgi:formylglycine-generating enzyme required for sulfatase activity
MQANFNGEAPYGGAPVGHKRNKTTPVGTFKPNAFGLYDVHGNVWQWCQDIFHSDYTGAPADGSAWDTGANSDIKVYRGGSWSNDGKNCRSAIRYATDHNTRTDVLGFRVAADLLASN